MGLITFLFLFDIKAIFGNGSKKNRPTFIINPCIVRKIIVFYFILIKFNLGMVRDTQRAFQKVNKKSVSADKISSVQNVWVIWSKPSRHLSSRVNKRLENRLSVKILVTCVSQKNRFEYNPQIQKHRTAYIFYERFKYFNYFYYVFFIFFKKCLTTIVN